MSKTPRRLTPSRGSGHSPQGRGKWVHGGISIRLEGLGRGAPNGEEEDIGNDRGHASVIVEANGQVPPLV